MSDSQETQPHQPTQTSGQLKTLQGQAYEAIGSILPAGTSEAWVESGKELQAEGQKEIDAAKAKAAVESTVDSASAKLKTGLGYITGDQAKQNEGNLEAEKAQWKYKQATSDSITDAIPVPSAEGIKGKLESVQGMVTGDQTKQQEGNLRAEKAAWKDGV